tara:strand:+ start:1705 stop:1926 length:222 start_codon:yes stop_codon:yes gene_type:complete
MAKKEGSPDKVKIDDIEYNISDLSENAKSQLQGINIAMSEIKRLNIQLSLMETARNAYGAALNDDLPEQSVED